MENNKSSTKKSRLPLIIGIVILAGTLIITFFVVQHFRKPGSMTVLESQAMDMTAMKAPMGSAPVAVEKIKPAPFQAAVTYTGSAVPFNEQDVSPRVSGWIEELKVYPGDKVNEGQLLAVLKADDLSTRLNEAQYAYEGASSEIQISGYEYQQSLADLSSTKSRVKASNSEVEKMKADHEYWKAEIKRADYLYKNGAISKDEYQSELARYKTSAANVKQAKKNLESSKADLESAAYRSKASAERILRSKIMAEQAKAAKDTAEIIYGYVNIKALISGIVTQRLISKGSLVSPGTVIFKIATIDPIRLQANVAQEDMAGIKIGNPVTIKKLKDKDSKQYILSKVTSVFPATDPTARTGIVEALTPNSSEKFLPGEYVIMEITKEKKEKALTVPSSAIVKFNLKNQPAVWIVAHPGAGAQILYTCVMHPEVVSDKPGNCPKCGMKLVPKKTKGDNIAHMVYIKTGASNGERTEILEGLKEGDEVIYAGYQYLNEGDPVFPTKWGVSGPEELPPPPAEETAPGMGNTPGMENMPGMKH
ncbi:MAG: efflux RND transporter periplasmic adaptor subunit [Firmicutes bacterium]|nr:efflux RND transporter periplasmic adaptor subunit [Bacillota bacterium]